MDKTLIVMDDKLSEIKSVFNDPKRMVIGKLRIYIKSNP